jgi:predicted enzyme related to lactoylglutathione lyase
MTTSNAGASARPVVSDRWRKAIAPVSAALLLATLGGCSTPKSPVPPLTPAPTGTYQIGKFVWYDLITDDVASVKGFYGGLFGWEFDKIETEKDNFTLVSHRGVPIAGIVYLEREDPAVSQSQWVSSVSVPDVDGAAEYVKGQGGSCTGVRRTCRIAGGLPS